MKICLVGLTAPFRGGIAQHMAILVQALQKCHTIKLLGFKHQYPRWLFPGKSQFDTSQIQLNPEKELTLAPLNPLSWWATFKKIKEFQPDWIFFQWWNPFFGLALGTLSRLCKGLANAKVAFFCYNVEPHERTPIDNLLTRYGLAAADYCLAHCDAELQKLYRLKLPCVAKKVELLPFSLSQSECVLTQAEARERLGLRGRIVLFFGYVRRYKGLSVLLDALPFVLQHIDCTLLVAGEFYDGKGKYLQQIQSLSLGKQVKIVDEYIPNEAVSHYFAAADVVILPYISAAQSGIVSLAYSYCKPVIATRVGGLVEQITEFTEGVEAGKEEFLVPPNDPSALSAAIVKFYETGWSPKLLSALTHSYAMFSHESSERLEEFIRHGC
jgi:glycosyltransferase involved in cell wall biosynthesis